MSHKHPQLKWKKLLFVILLNLTISIGQLIGGVISGSLSLISDSIHNFTDVVSLIISYVANKMSLKEQNLTKTFGFKRAEIIAAFVNGISLLVVSIFLITEAIERLFIIEAINANYVIWLSIIAIIANGLSVLILKKDAVGNLNMKSAYLHLFSDLLVSVAVLIGGVMMKYFNIYWIDQVLTIIISVYLFILSFKIVIESIKILMLFAPKDISISEIEQNICLEPKVKNIHHVHLWQLNDQEIYLEAHIEFNSNITLSEFDIICERIENELKIKFNISHSILQPEFNRTDEKKLIIQD